MLESLQAPLFFGLIAAFVTTLGLLAVALRSDWSQLYAGLFGLAAAGMLITMAFLHIMPEAFALSPHAPIWLTIGFFSGLVLSFTMQTVFSGREDSTLPSEAVTPLLAIAIHSF
ncbi:MAG: zinc ABC transporter permease, partial [Henriciella sp.]|nr:zinc ABC transporter permease [Henriciella sp.]